VIEHQIHLLPLILDQMALLATHKEEVSTKLQQERLKPVKDRPFEPFLVEVMLRSQAGELQQERLAQDVFRHSGLRPLRGEPQDSLSVPRERVPLVEVGVYLPVQLSGGPAGADSLDLIKSASVGVSHPKEKAIMCPAQLVTQ
jgi:hypothetical protein